MEDLQIELHLLDYRLRILSVHKKAIHKVMFPIVKIAFTNKTKCTFFSFTETNDDYSIMVDSNGFEEIKPFVNEKDVTVSQFSWIPMYVCGDDLPGCSMGISRIAKFVILPLADYAISIMAVSMYQCDYILIQEKDYDTVVKCLSNHIPIIYDEAQNPENEIVFDKKQQTAKLPNTSFANKGCYHQKQPQLSSSLSSSVSSDSFSLSSSLTSTSSQTTTTTNGSSRSTKTCKRRNSINNGLKPRQITLPLLIPDISEYCITGLYNPDVFLLIQPSLIEIMFFETHNDDEIFFNFTKKDSDISIVMDTKFINKFPSETLLNTDANYWKLVRIGQSSVGLEVFGVCASISQPLESANIDEYYISSYHTGYCFIPSDKLSIAKELFAKRKATFVDSASIRTPANEEEDNYTSSNYDEDGEEDDQIEILHKNKSAENEEDDDKTTKKEEDESSSGAGSIEEEDSVVGHSKYSRSNSESKSAYDDSNSPLQVASVDGGIVGASSSSSSSSSSDHESASQTSCIISDDTSITSNPPVQPKLSIDSGIGLSTSLFANSAAGQV